MCVSAKIFAFLNSNGISQTHLSRKAKIPLPKLNLALNGKRRFTFEEYSNICWALGVDTNFFLKPTKPNDDDQKSA
nr:MAG TPA: SOS-response transcriptional repressor [Caudoviricetes sp.]